jgi:dCMP deaminase
VYKPDFEIEYKDGRQVIEEVKGLLTELDNIKRLAAESFCAEKQYEYRLGVGLDQFEWSVPVIVEEYTNSYGTFGRPAMATAMMNMAKEISKRSTCLRNKVGAVICDVEHTQIYSLGHNGDEPGGANQCDSLTPGACGCLHAESTALMKAKRDLEGCVLYVTVAPCIMCSKSVVMTKIKKVVYLRKYRNEAGLNLLAKHGIEIVHYDTLVESNPRTQYGFVATRLCSDKPG